MQQHRVGRVCSPIFLLNFHISNSNCNFTVFLFSFYFSLCCGHRGGGVHRHSAAGVISWITSFLFIRIEAHLPPWSSVFAVHLQKPITKDGVTGNPHTPTWGSSSWRRIQSLDCGPCLISLSKAKTLLVLCIYLHVTFTFHIWNRARQQPFHHHSSSSSSSRSG